MKKQLIAFLSLSLLLAPSRLLVGDETLTNVAPAPVHSSSPNHLIYLTGEEAAWKNFPPKPALGSPVDQADLIITLSAQATRTDAQKAEADHDKKYSITLVTETIDPAFETKYPTVFEVLKKADNDEHVINSMIKNKNDRPRPYVQHPLLVTALFTVKDFSYPSGHASGSELQARILGAVFPDRANDLLNRARQIADSRVVAGVHYSSDVEAGQELGDLIFNELEANATFEQDLAAAVAKDGIPLK